MAVKKTSKKTAKDSSNSQPVINIGLIGHVDHGKTTLVSRLSGKWTDTHSEEVKRGITIRLGYANTTFYRCEKCKHYTVLDKCPKCKGKAKELRTISFIDAPGHETLMATMLSGSAIMDAALLLVAANETCPQPQTKEHLMALEILGIKKIIIVQNKIDLVSEEDAIGHYNQIKKFVKGTIAEKAPIIPISAQQNVNINFLIETIEKEFPTPKRDLNKDPIMFVARSFDVNKPGTKIENMNGGILGGALKQGILKIGDEIEIKPGKKIEKEGKTTWQAITTKIVGLMTGSAKIEKATPGGSIAIATTLDPYLVKSDSLTGNVVGLKGTIPDIKYELKLESKLLDRIIGVDKYQKVDPIKKGEAIMLNVNAAATVGIVTDISKKEFSVKLKLPVVVLPNDRITLSRMVGHRFRLIGYAEIK